MSLKKIELFGFKSFPDRTEIIFEPGVTCVVGPNGCGKSNISDAIRWVLGERSAKLLRGSKMEDVIFNGTDFRKPLGFAEVHLTISNSKKIIPIDYQEVVISRKIYRSGESEYSLNKTLCRHKDIQNLILDTGIGSNSYSMIEQGRIDYILQADPEERRSLIEEAAGISKFKVKKEEALKKLERTEENLLRLGDIISEIEKNIKYAERQAKRAEKYKEQFETLKQMEIKKALWELKNLETQKSELEEKKNKISAEQNELQRNSLEKEKTLKENRSKIQSLESELSFGELKKMELSSKINSLRDKIYFNVERIGSLKNQWLESENEIAASEERIKELHRETEKGGKDISLKEKELADKEQDLKKIQEAQASGDEELSVIKQTLEECRLSQMAAGKTRAEHHNEKIRLESRIGGERARMAERTHELRALEEEKKNLEAEIDQIKEKEKHLAEQQSVLEETLGVVEENLRMKENELESVLSRRLSLEGRRKELAAQIEIFSGKEGKEDSKEIYRLVDERRKSASSKLFGNAWFLKELIRPKAGFEALKEKLLSVFSEEILVFKLPEAFSEVKELTEGAAVKPAVFMFMESAPSSTSVPIEWKGSQLVPVTDQIEFEPGRDQEILGVFGQIYVSSKQAAELFSLAVPEMVRNRQILSEDGVLFGPGPFVTFPRIQGKNFSDEKLKKLIPAKELIERELAEYEAGEKRLKEERRAMNEDRTRAQEELGKLRTELASEMKRASTLGDAMIRLDRKIELLVKELEISHIEIADFERLISEHTQKTHDLDEAEGSLQEKLANLISSEKKQAGILEAEKLREVRQETEVTSLREKLALLAHHLEQSRDAIRTETQRIDQKRRSITEGGSAIRELTEENNAHSGTIEELVKTQSETEMNLGSVKENLETERNQFQIHQTEAQTLRETLERLREELHQADYRAMESTYERNAILDKVRQSYKVDLEKEDYGELLTPDDNRDEISLQITALKERLESFGAVNILAVEEYNELKSRYDFLASQRTDLVNARDALLDAIRKINRTTRKLFEETFKQVQGYFQEFFQVLFSGGQAHLALLDEENPLESGIEIMVRPPGKKLQQISLLSGGEKALTAIALLFSLFKIKPSPFCVLDEVDAPLDEANIDRFLNVLKSFLDSTQFLIITHNRKTISMGDALYGVTMEETGVSKIVSVRISQTEKPGELLKTIEIEK